VPRGRSCRSPLPRASDESADAPRLFDESGVLVADAVIRGAATLTTPRFANHGDHDACSVERRRIAIKSCPRQAREFRDRLETPAGIGRYYDLTEEGVA